MTLLGTEVEPRLESTEGVEDLDHGFCLCSPDVGICGADLTGVEEIDDLDELLFPCVVCAEMTLCPRCGIVFRTAL